MVLAGCAGYAALVLSTATWAEARAMDGIFPESGWHIRPFTAADLHGLQQSLAGAALGLTGLALALGAGTRASRQELRAVGHELRGCRQQLGQRLRALSQQQRWLAASLLLGLTLVRGYLSSSRVPWGDDVISYEFFVRQRLLAVSAYYPLPNNHPLANTISWAFYQLQPGFWWAVRLPVLLTSTAGTGLLFAGLLGRAGFRPALLAAGAFSYLQLSLYYAGVGRGYWLVILLAGVVFFALLHVLDAEGARPRLAWLGLLVAGVLGCYTVPTFVYVLVSAFGWLGAVAVWRRAPGLLGGAVVVGALVAGGAALLYAPLLLVSGPAALFANPYVQPLSGPAFWRALPAYTWYTEGFLAGQRSVGALLTLVVLALFSRLLYRAATGQLAAARARQVWQLGLPALWFVVVPYVVFGGSACCPRAHGTLQSLVFLSAAGPGS
ncbi:hypothetical protein [Hymenobacter sp. BRD67]|uniref:hypothetical protein n=1 Tax=Hymenobacter sp. BRD67 TaxID=2675877 RepID=UPI001565056B|nr:hypothetical protein [Hymenobacter sp. BRD67]QKG52504.1 hypothetical protein GKZ67_07710 [Hymenobacter sp. BRD67]